MNRAELLNVLFGGFRKPVAASVPVRIMRLFVFSHCVEEELKYLKYTDDGRARLGEVGVRGGCMLVEFPGYGIAWVYDSLPDSCSIEVEVDGTRAFVNNRKIQR